MIENWYDDTELEASDDEEVAPVDDLEAQEGDEDLGDAVTGGGKRFS